MSIGGGSSPMDHRCECSQQSCELASRRNKQDDVLTPDQKTQWETMQGKKLDLPALLRRGIPPAGK
jgi:hypothetical protein